MISCRNNFVDLDQFRGQLDFEYILPSLGIAISHIDSDEIVCHCPFKENHKNGDKNPSFNFNINKMTYQCWVCGGGNIVTLFHYFYPETDIEDWLREQASPITQTKSLKEAIHKPKENINELLEYPVNVLKDFEFYHDYLRERGISKEVAKKMRIGFDESHNGITIPHFFNNKLIGWQTRHLAQINGKYHCDTCNQAKTVPKYTNTPRFQKKSTLYNYSNALEQAKKGDRVIVIESPFTVLKLMSEGYENCVATFGAWSKEQMFSLIGCLPGVYLWGDNDSAGWSNVARVTEFISQFVPTSIVPVVEEDKGDAADLSKSEIEVYLQNTYSPFRLRKAQHLLTLKEVENVI